MVPQEVLSQLAFVTSDPEIFFSTLMVFSKVVSGREIFTNLFFFFNKNKSILRQASISIFEGRRGFHTN